MAQRLPAHVCIRPNIASAHRVGYAGVPNGTRHRCQDCGLLAVAADGKWVEVEHLPRDAFTPRVRDAGSWTTPWDRPL
jgi:hypothetical protein